MYANYLKDKEYFIDLFKSVNRSKGSISSVEWIATNKEYKRYYVRN